MTPECYGCLSVAYKNLKSVGSRGYGRYRNGRWVSKDQRKIEKAQKLISKAKRLGATQLEFPKIYDQWGRLDLTGFELSLKREMENF